MATHSEPAVEGRLVSASAAETQRIGRALGLVAQPGTCLALVGPLGAGKTQLAKGVAEGLGVASVVNSPTFIIMNEHAGRLPLFHVDAYRLTDGDEGHCTGVFLLDVLRRVTSPVARDAVEGQRRAVASVVDEDGPDFSLG